MASNPFLFSLCELVVTCTFNQNCTSDMDMCVWVHVELTNVCVEG